MYQLEQYVPPIPSSYWLALGIVVVGVVLSYLVGIVERRLLERAGVQDAIEGTGFERAARDLGTSTVSIVAKIGSYFVIILSVLIALTVAQVPYTTLFWNHVAAFLPRFLFAVLVLIVGVVVGDKVELLVAERLRGVKIPEIGGIPTVAKWTVFYVAALLALSLVGVPTLALIVLLAAYALGVIVLLGLASKDMLSSGAAGVYLLLNQPYGIGDRVRIGDREGIVQEVDILVTRIENDGQEHIVPNRLIFREGIVRERE